MLPDCSGDNRPAPLRAPTLLGYNCTPCATGWPRPCCETLQPPGAATGLSPPSSREGRGAEGVSGTHLTSGALWGGWRWALPGVEPVGGEKELLAALEELFKRCSPCAEAVTASPACVFPSHPAGSRSLTGVP